MGVSFLIPIVGFAGAGCADEGLARFREAWEQAREAEIPANVKFRYRQLLYPEMKDSELSTLEKAVEGKPDHPARSAVETERRRRQEGPDPVDYQVWYRGERAWRFNKTEHKNLHRGHAMYVDRVTTPDLIWAMVPTHLNIVDPSAPPEGRDYADARSEFEQAIRTFAWGALGTGESVDMQPRSARFDDQEWVAQAAAPNWSVIQWEGTVAEDGRLLPESHELVESERFAPLVGLQKTFSEWAWDPVLSNWIAHRVEERHPDGRLRQVWQFLGSQTLDREEFTEVTALPSSQAGDPVRGETTYRSIMDFRPGIDRIRVLTDAGFDDSPMPASMRAAPGSKVDLRTIGWVLAGILAAALLAVRIWTRRPRQHLAEAAK